MGGIFGGGRGSSSPAFIPSTNATYQERAVDADKSASDAADKQRKQLAANSNIATSAQGLTTQANVSDKTLLGQ